MGLFSKPSTTTMPASSTSPKHRSFLTVVKTIKTPKLGSRTRFNTESPALTGFDFYQADRRVEEEDKSLEKTKLLVDSSLKGEIERNQVLEMQLQQLGDVTSRAYDEIYDLQQYVQRLESEVRTRDMCIEDLKNEVSTLQEDAKNDRAKSVVSSELASTMNSMLSERVKSVSTANTSIHEVQKEEEEAHSMVNAKELEALKLALRQMEELVEEEREDKRTLVKANRKQSLEIVKLTEEVKSNLLEHNSKLMNFKTVFLQLSRNYNQFYLNASDELESI